MLTKKSGIRLFAIIATVFVVSNFSCASFADTIRVVFNPGNHSLSKTIPCTRVSFGAAETSEGYLGAYGRQHGIANIRTLKIAVPVNKATSFIENLQQRQSAFSASIYFKKKPAGPVYYSLELKHALISQITPFTDGSVPREQITLNFAQIIEHFSQQTDTSATGTGTQYNIHKL